MEHEDTPASSEFSGKQLAEELNARTEQQAPTKQEGPIDSETTQDTAGSLEEAPKATNPYEKLSDEQLKQVKQNILGSIADGVRKFDAAEVKRASINLMSIQRELEARFPDMRPKHERGAKVGDATFVTNLDQATIEDFTKQLDSIDGAFHIIAAMRNESQLRDEALRGEGGSEAQLQLLELQSFISDVMRHKRISSGSEFIEMKNPYSDKTNEELGALVDRFKGTISELQAKGQDTQELRNNLKLLGEVIKVRTT
jgi:hypothetical protein